MPVSRVQQREEALALFEMGAIDRRDLLEKLEWSGREALLGRLDGVAGGPVPARTPPPGALSDAGERPARADGDDVGVVPEKAL
jgi:hypothetical protein